MDQSSSKRSFKLLDLLSADPGPNRDQFWKAESIRCWDRLPRVVVLEVFKRFVDVALRDTV